MKVKSESEVAQSCPTLSDSMDCSPPDPSVHGIFQARVLEWVALECIIKGTGGETPPPALLGECPCSSRHTPPSQHEGDKARGPGAAAALGGAGRTFWT